jgi:hypothetical protein
MQIKKLGSLAQPSIRFSNYLAFASVSDSNDINLWKELDFV